MKLVLDASALLAFLNAEPGGEQVLGMMDGGSISAINWSEVVQKSLRYGANVDGMRQDIQDLGLTIVPFTAGHAEHAAGLWQETRKLGLSLADRACLALAMEGSATVLTADRAWAELGLGLDIRLLR